MPRIRFIDYRPWPRLAYARGAMFPTALRPAATAPPPTRASLTELHARGQLSSTPETLASLGFSHVHLADAEHDAGWLALTAARDALRDAQLEPGAIDVLIWASALPEN